MSNKKLKKAVRDRMKRTGETYSTARMHLLTKMQGTQSNTTGAPPPPPGGGVPGNGSPPTTPPANSGGSPPQQPNPESIIDPLLGALGHDLANNDDQVITAMGMTNATGFGLDTYEIVSADFITPNEITFDAVFYLAGEQDWNKPWSGSSLTVPISGTAEQQGGTWRISRYWTEDVRADF